ncbi:choice-of-anchor F family protein [Leucothrix mucor]|uniref:choice-of-anchor F family protein n=1 Tax=Leucothrix mucor TaxID=45248 RepID=UPI0003B79A13|nr:choice-of-anchor F family protein [Leucothrix mucor]
MKNLSVSMSLLAFTGVLSASGVVYADVGRIVSGSEGWNMDNVVTNYFDAEGNATTTLADDGVYRSDVFDRNASEAAAVRMGSVVAKNPPVGIPPGVKVVNAPSTELEARSGGNCLISTAFLDENPDDAIADYSGQVPVTCSSPFMTHKRYKVLMLPETVDGGVDSVDMVFNVENDTTTADTVIPYTVYQKINNWTDSRLDGYTLELGFGIGEDFTAASDTTLTFDNTENSTFSHGLFGPIEEDKFLENGFFSTKIAGYEASGEGLTTFTTTTAVGEYSDIGGAWLPSSWVPYGIFFDDDGDPDTDAVLMAWWGPGSDGTYQWMYGQLEHYADGEVPAGMTADFGPVSAEQVATWLPETVAEGTVNPYAVDLIEDFANLNLNYVVNVGAIGSWPTNGTDGASFTIRVTPIANDGGAPAYTLAANLPPQIDTTPDETDPGETDSEEDTSSSGGGAVGPLMWLLMLPIFGGLLRRRKA